MHELHLEFLVQFERVHNPLKLTNIIYLSYHPSTCYLSNNEKYQKQKYQSRPPPA